MKNEGNPSRNPQSISRSDDKKLSKLRSVLTEIDQLENEASQVRSIYRTYPDNSLARFALGVANRRLAKLRIKKGKLEISLGNVPFVEIEVVTDEA